MSAPEIQTRDSRGNDGVTGRLFVQAVRRHRTLFLGVLLVTAAAGIALWYGLPLPRHTGAVVFHVASQPPTVLAPTSESRVDFHTYRQTQASLVRKRHVLSDALSRPDIANLSIVRSKTEPVAWLEKQLVVDFRSGAEVMRVTLEGNEPHELRAVLAAVSRCYLAQVDEGENGQRRRRLEKLDAARQEQQERLNVFQKQIDTIALRLGSKDGTSLALQDQMAREELGHATRDLNDVESQLDFLARPAGKTDEPVPAELVNERLRLDPALAVLEADATKARDRAAEIAAQLKPGATAPALDRARGEAKAADDRLARATAALRPKIESTLKAEHAAAAAGKQSVAAEELKRLTKRQRAVQGQIEDLKARIAATSQARVDLENLKAQMSQIDKLGPSLTEETERLRLELGAPSRVTLAEQPYTLSGIEGNRRLKMTLLGVMGVFLAGYGGLVGWEYRTRRITHVRDAANGLGLRLLGTVPASGRHAKYLAGSDDPQRALAEAIDTTRTLLLYGAVDRRVRTLVVTSAVDGEGKTSLAGHLAISLTRAGYRTLLVDGDVQAPSANDLFNVLAAPGLCEVLRGEASVADAVHPTGLPGLSVMPAGAWDLGARQALAGDQWRTVKEELESGHDFVVVDSGPVLFVSDSLLMARGADGVLLSVLLDVSRVASVEETRDRLRAVGANVLGVVVSGVVTPAYRSIQARGSTDSARVVGLPA